MKYLLAICGLAALSACSGAPAVQLGPDGQPAQRVYQIDESQRGEITYRMLDSVNALRQARGMGPLQLNAALTAAAATHARDMAVQNRPWHFGSDGSSPLVRAQRAGYGGTLLGEDISETYQTETQTVGDWMNQTGTREVLLNRDATDVGISWYQESAGKLWWVINTGRGGGASSPYGMAMAQ
ncbi:CAP domain-containing protein [Falsirhodobacter halotolerans]|uniref:CAP domain-containing protein n=1 Tax=Falsirhodobacter halotolerans TaxID=1146892 RepID=UPI001FCF9C74|nr:CAP domain-containing protein [Falsirhodobacter halotolerans]MCJ8138326.1 CAP domain-containing protein [Falsirhodobacter halotolerans]